MGLPRLILGQFKVLPRSNPTLLRGLPKANFSPNKGLAKGDFQPVDHFNDLLKHL